MNDTKTPLTAIFVTLKIAKTMSKLFLICPGSKTEMMLSNKHSEQQFFVSAPGCAFNDPGFSYYNAIASFLCNFTIKSITFIHHLHCRFSRNAMDIHVPVTNFAEEELRSVLREHYFDIYRVGKKDKREEALIQYHLQRQKTILEHHPALLSILKKRKIPVGIALWRGHRHVNAHPTQALMAESYPQLVPVL
jgi:hypothetical protein